MKGTLRMEVGDDVAWAKFRRCLPESALADARVAWLGRDDLRARGDCLAPGTFVLAHPRFPTQFRADSERQREVFRAQGFTWTQAAAEVLAAERWNQLPVQGGRGMDDPLGAEDWALARARVVAGTADVRRNLESVVGCLHPSAGIPVGGRLRAAGRYDLSREWQTSWECFARDPGMESWPEAFREEWQRLNPLEGHRFETARGEAIDVVLANVTPLVLAFAPATSAGQALDEDGLCIEWRPFDAGLLAVLRETIRAWRLGRGWTAPTKEYLMVGLDLRYAAVPAELKPQVSSQRWEGYWARTADEAVVMSVPLDLEMRDAERALIRRLVPECWNETVERVRREVERLRADLYRGTIGVKRLAETLGLAQETVWEALRTLETVAGTGTEGFALRRIPGVGWEGPVAWEVVRPGEKPRTVLPVIAKARGWVRLVWLVYAGVASATLSYFVGKWVGDGNPPAWKAIGTAVLLSGLAALLRRWAERRAEAAETAGGVR